MITVIPAKRSSYITNDPKLSGKNMGADELLELQKTILDTKDVINSRILIDFNNQNILDRNVPSGSKYILSLKCLERREVVDDFEIDCFLISSSWKEGTGKKYFDYGRSGVTWTSRNGSDQWVNEGGDFYTSSLCSTLYKIEDSDLNVDVSQFYSSSFPENGILMKIRDESSSFDYGLGFYFTEQTKTIYPPELRICWEDDVYLTGSLDVLNSSHVEYVVYTTNLKELYYKEEIPLIRLHAREKYIKKDFQSWPYRTYPHDRFYNYVALPSESFYKIYDSVTEETILDFSRYTRISCDESGSFFRLDMSPFRENRSYKISVMVKENGIVNIYDMNNKFSIVNIK